MAKKKGLWANIHAKRERGEAPAKKGEKGYPSRGKIAWELWGGDAGKRWADSIWKRERAKKEK